MYFEQPHVNERLRSLFYVYYLVTDDLLLVNDFTPGVIYADLIRIDG